jgi:hypothetical protein
MYEVVEKSAFWQSFNVPGPHKTRHQKRFGSAVSYLQGNLRRPFDNIGRFSWPPFQRFSPPQIDVQQGQSGPGYPQSRHPKANQRCKSNGIGLGRLPVQSFGQRVTIPDL